MHSTKPLEALLMYEDVRMYKDAIRLAERLDPTLLASLSSMYAQSVTHLLGVLSLFVANDNAVNATGGIKCSGPFWHCRRMACMSHCMTNDNNDTIFILIFSPRGKSYLL